MPRVGESCLIPLRAQRGEGDRRAAVVEGPAKPVLRTAPPPPPSAAVPLPCESRGGSGAYFTPCIHFLSGQDSSSRTIPRPIAHSAMSVKTPL